MTSTASALVRKLEEIVLAAEELVQNLSGPSAPFVEAVLHLKQGTARNTHFTSVRHLPLIDLRGVGKETLLKLVLNNSLKHAEQLKGHILTAIYASKLDLEISATAISALLTGGLGSCASHPRLKKRMASLRVFCLSPGESMTRADSSSSSSGSKLLLVPELLVQIVIELQTTRTSNNANTASLLQLALTNRHTAQIVLPRLYFEPRFGYANSAHVASLLRLNRAQPAPFMLYLSLVKHLDITLLACAPFNDADPAVSWIRQTRLAHELASACPNLRSITMDGFPSDVTGTLFANMLFSIPEGIESIVWNRIAVSDGHLGKMVGRWPKLKSLRIGLVTPYMWGVRSIMAGTASHSPVQILSLNGVGGAHAASNYGGPEWASPSNSLGLSTFLETSLHLTHLSIQPLPGDDGTTHLLQVLSKSAPASLRTLTLGRGRYLAATQTSAIRLWRHLVVFLSQSRVTNVSIADPFSSCHRFCLAVWCLSDEFLVNLAKRVVFQSTRKYDARRTDYLCANSAVRNRVVDAVSKSLRQCVVGGGDLQKLARGDFSSNAEAMSSSTMQSSTQKTQPVATISTNSQIGSSNSLIAAELSSGIMIRTFGETEPLNFSESGIGILRELVADFGEDTVLRELTQT
ncbi:hypothetical protein HDU78_006693 [Chytriomyces hyalinus]|nr:hypothetical protein HDU78_006693 [Chytriomyces hyalinus]